MNDRNRKLLVITVIGMAVFGLIASIMLVVYLTFAAGNFASFEEWVSASSKFCKDAEEFVDKEYFVKYPSDEEIKKAFQSHKSDFELFKSMFVEDKLSNLRPLTAYDVDGRLAIYPYIGSEKLDPKVKENMFMLSRARYDKYRDLMKACKVVEAFSLGDNQNDGVGFTMYSKSLEPGKDVEDAKYYKEKGVSFWNEINFETFKTTGDVSPDEDGRHSGGVKIDSNWMVWINSKIPENK